MSTKFLFFEREIPEGFASVTEGLLIKVWRAIVQLFCTKGEHYIVREPLPLT